GGRSCTAGCSDWSSRDRGKPAPRRRWLRAPRRCARNSAADPAVSSRRVEALRSCFPLDPQRRRTEAALTTPFKCRKDGEGPIDRQFHDHSAAVEIGPAADEIEQDAGDAEIKDGGGRRQTQECEEPGEVPGKMRRD